MTQTTFKRVPFNLELAKKITNKEAKGRIYCLDSDAVSILFEKGGEE